MEDRTITIILNNMRCFHEYLRNQIRDLTMASDTIEKRLSELENLINKEEKE